MSDATPAPEHTQATGPQDTVPSRSAGLLGLIDRLLAYGRTLLEQVRPNDTDRAPPAIACQFGAVSLSLIIARITRGIMLATALRTRITRGASQLDARDRPVARTPAPDESPDNSPDKTPDKTPDSERPRRPRPSRPARQPVDEAAELHNLPSAEAIAERIRGRPIGTVIAEICRDLGIDASHELWRAVLDAITCNGGDRGLLVRTIIRRGFDAEALGVEPPPPPPWFGRLLAMIRRDEQVAPMMAEWAIPPPGP